MTGAGVESDGFFFQCLYEDRIQGTEMDEKLTHISCATEMNEILIHISHT